MIDLLFKIFPRFFLKQLFQKIDAFDIPAYSCRADKQLRHNWFSRFDLNHRYYIILKADMQHNILLISAYINFTQIKTKQINWLSHQEFQQFISDQLFDFKLELKKQVYPQSKKVYPHCEFYPPF